MLKYQAHIWKLSCKNSQLWINCICDVTKTNLFISIQPYNISLAPPIHVNILGNVWALTALEQGPIRTYTYIMSIYRVYTCISHKGTRITGSFILRGKKRLENGQEKKNCNCFWCVKPHKCHTGRQGKKYRIWAL